ncbi:hypothetical protein [Mycobacteroides abscessus]|uniref:hypothetical protein n=1 Tax=Mycobacteroides abscessus TaxID=36809 RepID=UPI0010563AF3|nr:hypothetical protein [Mycobacteroides abscessus]
MAETVLHDLGEPITLDSSATIVGEDFTISPNPKGEYDLTPLGFLFHPAAVSQSPSGDIPREFADPKERKSHGTDND